MGHLMESTVKSEFVEFLQQLDSQLPDEPLIVQADSHVCDAPYPVSCKNSISKVLSMLIGSEPMDRNCFINCCYGIAGFLLGMVFPHECTPIQSETVMAIDWKSALEKFVSILKIVLPLILE